jgi:hypothetical protein
MNPALQNTMYVLGFGVIVGGLCIYFNEPTVSAVTAVTTSPAQKLAPIGCQLCVKLVDWSESIRPISSSAVGGTTPAGSDDAVMPYEPPSSEEFHAAG